MADRTATQGGCGAELRPEKGGREGAVAKLGSVSVGERCAETERWIQLFGGRFRRGRYPSIAVRPAEGRETVADVFQKRHNDPILVPWAIEAEELGSSTDADCQALFEHQEI